MMSDKGMFEISVDGYTGLTSEQVQRALDYYFGVEVTFSVSDATPRTVSTKDRKAIEDMLAVQKAKDPLDFSQVSAGTVVKLIECLIAVEDLFVEAAQHLEYCSYGDSWERECAREDKLPERVQAMLKEIGGE